MPEIQELSPPKLAQSKTKSDGARPLPSFVGRTKLNPYFGYFVTASQVTADFLTVMLCYAASFFFYTEFLLKISPQTFPRFMMIAAVAGLAYVLIMDRVGLYRREISLLNVKELRGIFFTGIYGAALILSSSFYIRPLDLSRIMFTFAILITPVALYFERQMIYRLHLLFHQKGWSQKKVLIFGAGNIGKHLAKRMFESPSLGLLPVGFLDDDGSKHGSYLRWQGACPKNGVPIVGDEEFLEGCFAKGIDLVFIALPSAKFERNQNLVEHCIREGVEYAIVPNTYEKFIQQVEMFEIGGVPILHRRENKVSSYYLVTKRLLDFVTAAALIFVLSPIILIFGMAIMLDSKGPVIFKQKRVGLRGKEFSFYKFRTMLTTAPRYATSPNEKTDPRVTKVGRWLRRTSLDELPQLFNVLRGDMSLVGPRPEMPFIVKDYTPLERKRLDAKPGITGVWQISAVRGEPIHANLEYDLFYLQNRSLLLDFAILVKTFLSVIRGIGAN